MALNVNFSALLDLSQYPIVEARLAELSARVAPIADAVQGLKDLIEFINKERVRGHERRCWNDAHHACCHHRRRRWRRSTAAAG